MAVDQRVHARPLLLWESSGVQNYRAKGAGLGRNCGLCLIEIAPHFDGNKANQQGKRMPNGDSIPAETALKAFARSFTASLVTTK